MKLDPKRIARAIKDHVWGPMGSVIIHILVILALVTLVTYRSADKAPEIEVMMMEPDAVDLEEFEEELEKLEELPEMVEAITPPEVSLTETPPDVQSDFAAPDPTVDFAALDVQQDFQSPLVMQGLFAGRSAGGRASSLREYGGQWGQYTEAAVLRALEWLKNRQAPDGSWKGRLDPDTVGYTGLAILTFLAHGETTASEKYGATVEKGLRYLMGRQEENGSFMKKIDGSGPVYAQAIATYALSEAYGLTRIPALKPVMEKAVKVLIDGQQARGGWDYSYAKGARRDTSVTGWHVQALKAAYIAGAETPGIREALEKAAADLRSAQDPESGAFGYSHSQTDRRSEKALGMTGVAVLCMQLMGLSSDSATRKGFDALSNATCDWNDPMNSPFYAWYYITQVSFHRGGAMWSAWNNKVAPTLVRNQNEKGYWPDSKSSNVVGERGGAESDPQTIYRTTLAALTLQVYYRLLPTYKAIALEPATPTSKDDIAVEIL
ncbi:MAG: terpene cyclase/mutase family protein [Verrucomicrobia bacterium]|nr:terpene cyclase/mutase family protein [Verrucomicrobiota bacterium]